jgi:putative glycosyltransferase (TIGR04348 family)
MERCAQTGRLAPFRYKPGAIGLAPYRYNSQRTANVPRIVIVTPAPPGSRKGNRITASRWARMLRSLGHQVVVREKFQGERCDLLVALHARKSANDVAQFRRANRDRPIVLVLTGTDLYGDIHSSRAAQKTLDLADRLVLLQPAGESELPKRLRSKARVIFQSAISRPSRPRPLKSVFEISVCGHLRPVKDPFRAAIAARSLPPESRIRITQIGAALTDSMKQRAAAEVLRNSRYRWSGEVSNSQARRLVSRSRLLVLSSKLEGGANVISEALADDVPVLSTRISGSIGLLGEDYEGYFEVGDTRGLTDLMLRCEQDERFLTTLRKQCQQRARLLTPAQEEAALQSLLDEFALQRSG